MVRHQGAKVVVQIREDQWLSIDDAICANRKLPAIQQIRAASGCSLKDALELLYERYAKLRAEASHRFSDSEEEYWAGFYS